MHLEIRGQHLDVGRAARFHAERRLRFALGRFASRVGRVAVRVADVNGPRGGTDKRCRIVVALGGAGTVVVEDRDADVYAAIDAAADRAGRLVARALHRAA